MARLAFSICQAKQNFQGDPDFQGESYFFVENELRRSK